MLEVRVTSNYKAFAARIDDFAKRQLPFATSRALTATAKSAHTDVVQTMTAVFDRPTPYTQKAFFIKASTRSDPVAFIGVRSFAGKGTPAWKFLAAQQSGGGRHLKRFESAFAAAGGGLYAMPAEADGLLDEYGNVSEAKINQILAALRGKTAKRNTARLRKLGLIARSSADRRSQYFIGYDRDGQPRFIMELLGPGKVRPVFVFPKRSPHYEPRFPFQKIVETSINRNFMRHMRREFDDAVRTAFARGKL